jgi:putative ABC transport system ATP-binding protein
LEPDVIAVRDAEFAYPEGGFHLRVPELAIGDGETVAVTGPSGAGKTTLINLLSGLLVPRAGRVSVLGLDLGDLSPEDRQDLRVLKLGLVFQELELLDYLDVLDNILLPYRITPVLSLDASVRERATSLAHEVGLGDKLARLPGQLSQGERQRVAVCRALVTRPAVLFGDEPTGNLDRDNRDHVADALFRYAEQTGAPLIVVSHDPELVNRFQRRLDVGDLSG